MEPAASNDVASCEAQDCGLQGQLAEEICRRLSCIDVKLAMLSERLCPAEGAVELPGSVVEEPSLRHVALASRAELDERGSTDFLDDGLCGQSPTAGSDMLREQMDCTITSLEEPSPFPKRHSGWSELRQSNDIHGRLHKRFGTGIALGVGHWIDDWEQQVKTARQAEPPRLWRIVHSVPFEVASCILIVLHALLIGVSSGSSLRVNSFRAKASDTDWVELAEIAFCCIFSIELVVRIFSEQQLFIFGENWRWNLVDVFLVLFSLADVIVNGLTAGDGAVVTVARLLRLTRFIRIWRVTRVLRYFSSLRIITYSVLASSTSLLWIFGALVIILNVFALVFAHGASEHLRSVGPGKDDEVSNMLRESYPDILSITQVLFMSITGGIDYRAAVLEWAVVSPFYRVLFYVYVFIMQFGVLNVVTSTFVAATARIVSKDREEIVKNELIRVEDYMKKVVQFYRSLDTTGSGQLTWDTFQANMEKMPVMAYFQALDLDVTHARDFFEMLDTDETASVSVDEFIEGCLRLRGGARSIDVNMVLHQCRKLTTQLCSLQKKSQRQLDLMDELTGRGALRRLRSRSCD